MEPQIRRLYRSREETQLLGICGGVGIYFGIDPVMVRLLWILGTLVTGVAPGVLGYLLAWLVIPMEPHAAPVATAPSNSEAPQPGL